MLTKVHSQTKRNKALQVRSIHGWSLFLKFIDGILREDRIKCFCVIWNGGWCSCNLKYIVVSKQVAILDSFDVATCWKRYVRIFTCLWSTSMVTSLSNTDNHNSWADPTLSNFATTLMKKQQSGAKVVSWLSENSETMSLDWSTIV